MFLLSLSSIPNEHYPYTLYKTNIAEDDFFAVLYCTQPTITSITYGKLTIDKDFFRDGDLLNFCISFLVKLRSDIMFNTLFNKIESIEFTLSSLFFKNYEENKEDLQIRFNEFIRDILLLPEKSVNIKYHLKISNKKWSDKDWIIKIIESLRNSWQSGAEWDFTPSSESEIEEDEEDTAEDTWRTSSGKYGTADTLQAFADWNLNSDQVIPPAYSRPSSPEAGLYTFLPAGDTAWRTSSDEYSSCPTLRSNPQHPKIRLFAHFKTALEGKRLHIRNAWFAHLQQYKEMKQRQIAAKRQKRLYSPQQIGANQINQRYEIHCKWRTNCNPAFVKGVV